MASYPKPTNTGSTFNAPNWIAPTVNSADTAFLNANYCQYPIVQGGINTKSITATGSVGVSSNILMNGVAGVNYIEFPDGTKQYTGTQDFSGYAFTDISNTFTKLNTFDGNLAIGGTLGVNYIQYPDGSKQYTAPAGDDINTVYNDVSNTFLSPTIQKFQGSNATTTTTAPLQFTNVSTGEFGSLYVDPSVNNDLTLYSNQSGGGLTIRNSTNSFTINPTTTNTASFLNPIVSSGSITGNSFKINTNTIGDDLYSIESFGNFGLYIVNTSNNNGKITLSNNGSIYASITCTAQNEITCSGSLIVSSQTYPLASSNQTATIGYVNDALQGVGDITSTGNNNFSGINTFSNFCGTSATQTYPLPSGNQFTTTSYVNNLNTIASTFTLASQQASFTGSLACLLTSSNLYQFTTNNSVAFSPYVPTTSYLICSSPYISTNITFSASITELSTNRIIGATVSISYGSTTFSYVRIDTANNFASGNYTLTFNGYAYK